MRCGGWLDHPSISTPKQLNSITAHAGQNDQGVGSICISGKLKGAVRRAESKCAVVGGGQSKRKGAAMSAR